MPEASNGLFVGNDQIVIDINSDYGMLTATFTHEGFHYLEKRNKAAAEELKKFVFDMLGEEGAKKARKEMRARGYEEKVIDSEIVADSLFDVLSEKGIIERDVERNACVGCRYASSSFRQYTGNAFPSDRHGNVENRTARQGDELQTSFKYVYERHGHGGGRRAACGVGGRYKGRETFFI